MKNIKVKDVSEKGIKTIDKTIAWTERVKDPIVYLNEKVKDTASGDGNAIDYGEDKIKYYSNRLKDESTYHSKKILEKSKNKMIKEYEKSKLMPKGKSFNIKDQAQDVKKVADETKKNMQRSKIAIQQFRRISEETAKKTVHIAKVGIKALVSGVKALIQGLSSLIGIIASGGVLSIIIIIIVCLVGLLCTSIFGIFLSSEKTNKNSITMKDVVSECNIELSNRLQNIQDTNPHDEYVLDGNIASWKDILIIYTARESKGNNQNDVVTMSDSKKNDLKQIFWDMNQITYEVKNEMVIEKGVNADEMPKQLEKKVLHIAITSKNTEQMKLQYGFNTSQLKQVAELSDSKYAMLWSNAIYGSSSTGDYISWRQTGEPWSNIKIGSTNSTIGDIGCLVTSISILIEKSGIKTSINNFNPGTFVEELNKNGGFDSGGNLQYSAISKIVPEFKYAGNINLRGKTREEKTSLIKQYFNEGYFLTIEVKGATPGNQHWVAIINVNDNNVTIVDPGTNQTDLWSAYEYSKSSQFNYFKVN